MEACLGFGGFETMFSRQWGKTDIITLIITRPA